MSIFFGIPRSTTQNWSFGEKGIDMHMLSEKIIRLVRIENKTSQNSEVEHTWHNWQNYGAQLLICWARLFQSHIWLNPATLMKIETASKFLSMLHRLEQLLYCSEVHDKKNIKISETETDGGNLTSLLVPLTFAIHWSISS